MIIQALRYASATSHAFNTNISDIAVVSPGVPAAEYLGADIAAAALAMLAALNTPNLQAVYHAFHEPAESRAIRGDFSLGINGADGHTLTEDWYLVGSRELDGNFALVLEKAASIAWTCGPTAILTGARNGHKWPKSAVITETGVLAAHGLKALATVVQTPAVVSMFDIGPFRGVLRMMSKGASATGVAAMSRHWR